MTGGRIRFFGYNGSDIVQGEMTRMIGKQASAGDMRRGGERRKRRKSTSHGASLCRASGIAYASSARQTLHPSVRPFQCAGAGAALRDAHHVVGAEGAVLAALALLVGADVAFHGGAPGYMSIYGLRLKSVSFRRSGLMSPVTYIRSPANFRNIETVFHRYQELLLRDLHTKEAGNRGMYSGVWSFRMGVNLIKWTRRLAPLSNCRGLTNLIDNIYINDDCFCPRSVSIPTKSTLRINEIECNPPVTFCQASFPPIFSAASFTSFSLIPLTIENAYT
jgi:hypothetical protein